MKQLLPNWLYIEIILIIGGSFAQLKAQNDSTQWQEKAINVLELSMDNDLEDGEYSEELLEQQEDRVKGKPNLNNLDYETAIKVLHLSDYQYYQLQLYIETQGELVSIYELDAVEGFTKLDRERLERLVQIAPAPQKSNFLHNFFKKGKSNLLLRYGQTLEPQAGYDTTRDTHYAGNPAHVCFRYTFETQDRFYLKISGEKDAGEQFFKGEQRYGFDFYSGSLNLKNIGVLKQLAVGDYRLNFGQGLVMGSSLLSGKGGGVDAARRFASGIRAVAPTNEGAFLRGAAATLGNTSFIGTLFAGRQFGDVDNCLGTDFSYRHKLFRISARFVGYSSTDTSLSKFKDRLSSSFVPTGFNAAMDYHVILRQQLIFGEISANQTGALGMLHCGVFNLSPLLKIAAIFRYYVPHYSAPLGRSFGNSSHNTGETGLYFTGQYIIGRRCIVGFFLDYYRNTWLSYLTEAPVQGLDAGITTQYDINRNSKLVASYQFRNKPENGKENTYTRSLMEHLKHRLRIQWVQNPLSFLKLKTEVSWILNHYPLQHSRYSGCLLFQDVAFNIKKPDFSVHIRFAYFDTDRYDERLYAYEDDVYYAFTIGTYYYKGVRGYILVRYKFKWLSLWLRLAHTHYIDRNSIGSGLNAIGKPHKTDLRIQLMITI